jgi:hypothetical protein
MDRQDSVESGAYIFGQPVPPQQAFPTIASLKAKVLIRSGGPMDENPRERYLSLESASEYVRCPRSSCVDGGWCIADAIRDMVAKNDTHRETGGICSGKERMNRSMFRKCLTHFHAEIDITYKPAEPAKSS